MNPFKRPMQELHRPAHVAQGHGRGHSRDHASPPQAGITLAQDKPEISMWFDSTNGPETAQCMIDGVITPYNESGTATVKTTLQANNWDAVRTALSGGEGPDVVGTPGPSFAFVAGQGRATAARWTTMRPARNGPIPSSRGRSASDWSVASSIRIPNEVETAVFSTTTRRSSTDKGWEPPTTMDELMTLAQKINDAGIIPFAHCNKEWRPANEWFVGEFMNHGGGPQKVYDALTAPAS